MNAGRRKLFYLGSFVAFARLSAKCNTTSEDPQKTSTNPEKKCSWGEYFTAVTRLLARCSTTIEDPKKENTNPEKKSTNPGKKGNDQTTLSWEEYFMAVARLSATRSKDPATQVGACIVSPDKKIVATGYNGMPWGCPDSNMDWLKEGHDDIEYLESKTPYVVHAEYNAIINKQSVDVKGHTMYVTLFPCNECAKLIIQSKIAEVVYVEKRDKSYYKISEEMLREARVKMRAYKGKELKFLSWSDDPNEALKMSDLRNQKKP